MIEIKHRVHAAIVAAQFYLGRKHVQIPNEKSQA